MIPSAALSASNYARDTIRMVGREYLNILTLTAVAHSSRYYVTAITSLW